MIIVTVNASLFHLVLLSGERYIDMKHTFAYPSLVTRRTPSCILCMGVVLVCTSDRSFTLQRNGFFGQ